MKTIVNNSFPNIILLAALSTSVVSLSYSFDTLVPLANHQYSYQADIANWKELALYSHSDYQLVSSKEQNIRTILKFSKTVINNSKDIDSEYVDIVNENFWDLI